MGSVSSSKSTKSHSQSHHSNNKSSHKKHGFYRVPTCKYHEKCPSIKNVKHKHYTIYDLNHLTKYSHPRKHCQYGLKCKYFENVMSGSYSMPDLCHYSIYLHPISRFITSFPQNKKDEKPKTNEHYLSSMMYNSLQMPRSGEKMGLTTYKKLGIMICDGSCGSIITRGLWKCWNFRDLIWNYKYRKYKAAKDPNYNKGNEHKQAPMHISMHKPHTNGEDRKDIQQCLVTMIESVIALAGEGFLIQMYHLMNKSQDEHDTKMNDTDAFYNGAEPQSIQFGQLLLLFSNVVRTEFDLEDKQYPMIKKQWQWQCPMIYGVLIGMINDKMKLNVEKYKLNVEKYSATKRKLKDERKQNIRKQIFISGCRHSSRDLFKELQVNKLTNVLSIPKIQTGDTTIDAHDTSTMSFVAPNAPPTYRANCVHYQAFKSSNFINYDWSSLQEVAREKLHHPRHLEMGSCLEEEELLSILLLTGTCVGLDLIESHRKYRNYCKWRVLQTNLMSALLKLKSHDRSPSSHQFFHGLLRQKRDSESQALSVNNIYLFNTFVSTTLDHRLIESSFHNKKDGALLFLDRSEPVVCADISWISKFPFEHEVLFAPCALKLPSPFDDDAHAQHEKHLSPKEDKKKRMSSIAEISSHHMHQKKALYKKRKTKDKKVELKKEKEERTDSLAGFVLVDGRLGALSYDVNDDQFLYKGKLSSGSDEETDHESYSVTQKQQNVKHKPQSSDIDSNVIASFLYGKTTANDLFIYLCKQFCEDEKSENKEKYIDEDVLQKLFQSLFVFAIQHEYVTRNNGIKAKYINKYMHDIYEFAQKYSTMFIGKINEENAEYKLNTNKITKIQFLNHGVYLHQLYEEFLETIIANEMSLKYERWTESDHSDKKIAAINTSNNRRNSEESTQSDALSDDVYNDDDDEDDNDDDEYEDDEYEEEEYEDEYETEEEDDDDINEIIEHVNAIGAFCRNEIDLTQLWMHFTDQEWDKAMSEKKRERAKANLMNYIQFDVIVYVALAFFVMERNPDSALASRDSLNALIDQLRLSLLAAYDPENNGYVTFNAFGYFGEYLIGEYQKLRGSLAATPKTTAHSIEQYENDVNDNDLEEQYDEKDVMLINSLQIMEQKAQNIIQFLVTQIQELNEYLLRREENKEDDEEEDASETICTEISIKTQKLLYLTKEMEILCNSLVNDNLRYKNATIINYIDSKREEILQDFNELIAVESD